MMTTISRLRNFGVSCGPPSEVGDELISVASSAQEIDLANPMIVLIQGTGRKSLPAHVQGGGASVSSRGKGRLPTL